jgi:hypothetical protein
VTIRYNRAKIPFRIGARSPVQGIIKVPGGTAHHFKTDSRTSEGIYTQTVYLPWTNEDYFVVFAGASAATEAAYALAINTSLPSAAELFAFDNNGIYETPEKGGPNNDEAHAVSIRSQDSIMAYVHVLDIDYYKINLGNEVPVVKLVPLERFAFSESNGNSDGTVNPGEDAFLDLVVKNETEQSRSMEVSLAATGANASYVTVTRASASIPSLSPQYYVSLTGSQKSSSDTVDLFVGSNLNSAFKITVSPACPFDTTISFDLSFTDSQSMIWTESVALTVVKPDSSIAIAAPVADNCVLVQSSGNSDGFVNPGESFSYNITIKNSGTRAVSGLQGTLSTTASGVTINTSTVSLGELAPGANKTAGFSFTVSSSCPPGTVIPFTLNMESSSTTWEGLVPSSVSVRAAAPTGVQAAGTSTGSVYLTWEAVTGATTYQVFYATSEAGPYTAKAGDSATNAYTHTGLASGTIYYYKVSASGSLGGVSELSAAASAKTWMNMVFNKSVVGAATGSLPDQYSFYVTNGVSYTFTSNTSCDVIKDNGSSWFSLSSGSPQTQTAGFTGWASIRFGNAGAYSFTIASSELAVSSFNIGSDAGTINHTSNTIAVLVPYATSLASLTPVVTPASGWTCNTGGAKNFSSPVEYLFSKDDVIQAYTVTVTRKGQGEITITPPGSDISVAGFPTAPFTVSRNGSPQTHTITISDTSFSSYAWYVDDTDRTTSSTNGNRTFAIAAANYVIGKHTVTIIVVKGGVPYSNEQSFTVTN